MKAKCNKTLCSIGAIIAIIVAIFFALPAKSYKACKGTIGGDHSFWDHCIEYWKNIFSKKENKPAEPATPAPADPENKPADEQPEADGKLQTVQPTEDPDPENA